MGQKKKGKEDRKQAKRKRTGAVSHRNKEAWPTQQSAPLAIPDRELAEDMLPIFSAIADAESASLAPGEELVTALEFSDELIGEPEFVDIFFPPVESAGMFVQVAVEKGMTPESFMEMSGEEAEEARLDIMEESLRRSLTDERCREIVTRLSTLRLRLKQSGKRMEAAKVAALQWVLDTDKDRVLWPTIPLLLVIFERSVDAGFKIAQVSAQASNGPDVTELGLLDRLMNAPLTKLGDLVTKIPGLRTYLEKQVDKTWDRGEEAVMDRQLYLGLYTDEECARARQIMLEVIEADPFAVTEAGSLNRKTERALVQRMDEYVTELFTPERLNVLRQRVDTLLKEPQTDKNWLPFLLLLRDSMADQDAVQYEKKFLLETLLAEVAVHPSPPTAGSN